MNRFYFCIKKSWILQHQHQQKCISLCFYCHRLFCLKYAFADNIVRYIENSNFKSRKYLLELIRKRTKVLHKKKSCECVLNFDQ